MNDIERHILGDKMRNYLISSIDAGETCRITFREIELMFPPIRDDSFMLRVKPIIVSSGDRFKKYCLENKYFYQYDFSNNTYLVSK